MLIQEGTRARTAALGRKFCALCTKINSRVVMLGKLIIPPRSVLASALFARRERCLVLMAYKRERRLAWWLKSPRIFEKEKKKKQNWLYRTPQFNFLLKTMWGKMLFSLCLYNSNVCQKYWHQDSLTHKTTWVGWKNYILAYLFKISFGGSTLLFISLLLPLGQWCLVSYSLSLHK